MDRNYLCCNVKTCAYNDEESHCTASEVIVGPQFANSTANTSDETVCATFFPKSATGINQRRFKHS